jgi:hypothetical protein
MAKITGLRIFEVNYFPVMKAVEICWSIAVVMAALDKMVSFRRAPGNGIIYNLLINQINRYNKYINAKNKSSSTYWCILLNLSAETRAGIDQPYGK